MRKKTLLIIDRDQVLMNLTKRILERSGYSVSCAVGFAEALVQLEDFTPDGIILTDDLPDGDGLLCCRKLREKSNVPIFYISGKTEDELSALRAGANDFMKKPEDFEIMKERLCRMVQ